MRRKLALGLMLAAFAGFALPLVAGEAADDDAGFVPIFNGKDLTSWDGDPTFWSVKDGVIHGETTLEKPCRRNTFCIWRGNDAVKDGILKDFEMKVSFRFFAGNSGVQYRSHDCGNWVVKGYQAEVTDNPSVGFLYHEGGRGSLVQVGQKLVISEDGKKEVVGSLGDAKEIFKSYKMKDWNAYRIICKGNHVVQILNDIQTIDLVDNQLNPIDVVKGRDEKKGALSGIFALQIHAGGPMVVEFKDIKLKVLKKEEAQ